MLPGGLLPPDISMRPLSAHAQGTNQGQQYVSYDSNGIHHFMQMGVKPKPLGTPWSTSFRQAQTSPHKHGERLGEGPQEASREYAGRIVLRRRQQRCKPLCRRGRGSGGAHGCSTACDRTLKPTP